LSFYFCSCFFFFSSRRRHTRFSRDWSSDVCSSDLKTALGIYLIAAIATMLVWGSETYAGVGTGYDMLAQPFLAALMLVMWVALRRVPGALLTTQRIAVSAVCLYFALGTANAMFLSSHMATPYWVASNFQWMPVIALLLHLIWPWRWAVTFSLALLGLVAIPP